MFESDILFVLCLLLLLFAFDFLICHLIFFCKFIFACKLLLLGNLLFLGKMSNVKHISTSLASASAITETTESIYGDYVVIHNKRSTIRNVEQGMIFINEY